MRATVIAGAEIRPLLTGLLPDVVAFAEVYDDASALPLYPEEWEAISRAVQERRREFATARTLARACLAQLGHSPVPLLPDADRAPRWPPGFVGSMTHCDGFRAAAVARAADLASLGIDAEPHEALPEGVLDSVTVPAERGPLTTLAATHPGIAWDRLLFSAKESMFKAWFPLTRRWLDFTECVIEFEPEDGTFSGRVLMMGHTQGSGASEALTGRWAVSASVGGGHLATAVSID